MSPLRKVKENKTKQKKKAKSQQTESPTGKPAGAGRSLPLPALSPCQHRGKRGALCGLRGAVCLGEVGQNRTGSPSLQPQASWHPGARPGPGGAGRGQARSRGKPHGSMSPLTPLHSRCTSQSPQHPESSGRMRAFVCGRFCFLIKRLST